MSQSVFRVGSFVNEMQVKGSGPKYSEVATKVKCKNGDTERSGRLYRVARTGYPRQSTSRNTLPPTTLTQPPSNKLFSSVHVERKPTNSSVTWSFHTSQPTTVSRNLSIWFKLTTARHLR